MCSGIVHYWPMRAGHCWRREVVAGGEKGSAQGDCQVTLGPCTIRARFLNPSELSACGDLVDGFSDEASTHFSILSFGARANAFGKARMDQQIAGGAVAEADYSQSRLTDTHGNHPRNSLVTAGEPIRWYSAN